MTEAWFDISVQTTRATSWLPEGHSIARISVTDRQLVTKFAKLLPASPELLLDVSPTVVTVADVPGEGDDDVDGSNGNGGGSGVGAVKTSSEDGVSDAHLRISWSTGAWAVVGKRCGRITRWFDAQGRSLLSVPLDVCLWRAPTDNDRGGSFVSHYANWKAAGLGSLTREPQANAVSHCESLFDGSLIVKTDWTLVPPTDAPAGCRIPCSAVYTFLPTGAIRVETSFYPPSSLPPIPRYKS
jgi:hypothetical protein